MLRRVGLVSVSSVLFIVAGGVCSVLLFSDPGVM